MNDMQQHIGILGGSFNPVHYGHLLLAESARSQAQLDQVYFIPTNISPLKQSQQPAPDQARVEMLQLAIAGNSAFAVNTMELDRGGVSYTVDTLQALYDQQPHVKWYFLMGADSLADFAHRWKEPARIAELATILVVRRAGETEPQWDSLRGVIPAATIAAWQAQQIEMPLLGFSSTKIRERLAAGQSIRYWVPRAVEEYLHGHELYRTASRTA
jgi:nicotinate-nucleotide adenylyltransferase